MNTSLGYSKKTLTDTDVLLSGGGNRPLSDFIGSISWDSTNKKMTYTPVGGSATDLITFGSNAFTSDSYALSSHTHTSADINDLWKPKRKITTSGTSPYEYAWLCRFYVPTAWVGIPIIIRIASRFDSFILANLRIRTGATAYGTSTLEGYILGKTYKAELYYVKTEGDQTLGYDTFDFYAKTTSYNTGFYWDINLIGNTNGAVIEYKELFYDTLPLGAILIEEYKPTNAVNADNLVDPTKYYWANVKLSSSSSTTTSPTFTNLTASGTINAASIINTTYNSADKFLMSNGSVRDLSDVSLFGHTHTESDITDLKDYLLCFKRGTSLNIDTVDNSNYIYVAEGSGSYPTITKPTGMGNAFGVIHLHTYDGNYAMLLGFGAKTSKMYFRNAYHSSFGNWKELIDSNTFNTYLATALSTSTDKWEDIYVTNINGVAVGTTPKFTDTFRKVLVSGTEKLSAATDSGDLKFVNGNYTTVTWDTTNQTILYDCNLIRSGTATSLTSLDTTKSFIYATLSTNVTAANFTLSAAMTVGLCLTVLIYNSGSTTITIEIPSTWLTLDGYTLSCLATKFLEISIVRYASGTNDYIVSSKMQ